MLGLGAATDNGSELQAYLVGIGTTLRTQTLALRERLSRTTRRERLMLGGLALAVFLYAPIAVLEWRSAQTDAYVTALTERSAARLALASARRVAADPAQSAVLDDMNSWGFEASNIAVARVRIEQRLLEEAAAAGLANPRVTVAEEIETIGPIQWLDAEVQADLTWAGTFGFLDGLTAWPEGFQVRAFSYTATPTTPTPFGPPVGRASTVTIGLAFPVRLTTVEPTT